MRFQISSALICLVLLYMVGSPTSAFAQQVGTPGSTPTSSPGAAVAPQFSIKPVGDYPEGYFADVEGIPGATLNLSAEIMNFGEIPVSVRTFKVNAHNAINGGFIAGVEGEDPTDSNTWVEYPAMELSLDPGEKQEIDFTVTVPEDAQPGQYISGLTVETAEPLPISGTQSLTQIIGYSTTVGVLIPGEITHSFELEAPGIIDRTGTREIQIPIANTGNYLVRPSGELTLSNADDDVVLTSPVTMKSVYRGLSTAISIPLPDQIEQGDYTLDLTLTDDASGAKAEIKDAKVTVKASQDATGVSVASASIKPNAEPIAFANVDIALNNGGREIRASNVTLEVLHDGRQVDSFPLATNQILLQGENVYTTRYIPATTWESGTYTFHLVVSSVDPGSGQATNLLTQNLDAIITVP